MSTRALRAGGAAVVAAVIGLGAAVPAFAQQSPTTPDPAEAEAALRAAERVLQPADEGPRLTPQSLGEQAAPDVTIALNRLAAALPALEGADRRRARGLLSRPTDGNADAYGDGYPPGAEVGVAESAHFCVYWLRDGTLADAPDLTDTNANGIPEYAEAILGAAEYSYSIEVAPGPMGWVGPKPDKEGCGADPSAHADIYLKQLGDQGLFGYESTDPGQGRARSQHGYLVLDDDYAITEYGTYADPFDPARVTIAHEFNHLLQQNYDSFQDIWMFESSATWAEEQVFGTINDYLNYLPSYAKNPGQPITDAKGGKGLKIYGSAVWNHWLSVNYGPGVLRAAWDASDKARPADFAVASYDKAIDEAGGKGFGREFTAFAAATAEWQVPSVGFPDSGFYPDVKRAGSLGKGKGSSFKLDHTAYRLFNVTPSGDKVRLRVKGKKGVRYGIALVGRAGDTVSGAVARKTAYASKGGRASVTLKGAFTRVTAVVINADGRVKGFKGDDWVYAKDNQRFKARISG